MKRTNRSGAWCVSRTLRCRRGGFSLVEIVVVLTIIGILAVICVPSYQRAMEQSRADIVGANLRAIWSAQRLYWLDYHAYTSDLARLRTLGLVDPEIVGSSTGYAYSIPSSGNDTFQAAATRTGNTSWYGGFTIDDTGAISGTLCTSGQTPIVPGFQ